MNDIKTIQLSKNTPGQSRTGGYGAGCLVTIFQDDDGDYGYCYHGVSADGNFFESDDVTGLDSVKEAEADARANYRPMPGD